jgi:hypothetical protein
VTRTKPLAKEFVLWGFHPRYTGPAGVVPIRLAAGTMRDCNTEHKYRTGLGGWTLGIYAKDTYPLGLALQCKAIHQTPTKTWDGVPLEIAGARQKADAA